MFVRSIFSGFRRAGSVLRAAKPRAVSNFGGRRRVWVGAAATAIGVGLCASASVAFAAEKSGKGQEQEPAVMMSPESFNSFEVKGIVPFNHDSLYIFLKGQPQPELDFPVASFVLVRMKVGGKEEVRPYTPIFVSAKDGTIAIAVKSYGDGVVSKRLAKLQKGDKVEVKGPITKLAVHPNTEKHIVMISGGSGITPMLQILRHLQKNNDKKTKLTIINANHTLEDIWFRPYFDDLLQDNPLATVHHFLTKPPQNWQGHTGRITLEELRKIMPHPKANVAVLVCGPPGLVKDIAGPKTKDYKQGEVEGMLKELGYSSENVYKF